jgi:hypothetical protein
MYVGSILYYFLGLTGIFFLIYIFLNSIKSNDLSQKDSILIGLLFFLAYHPFIYFIYLLLVFLFLILNIRKFRVVRRLCLSIIIGSLINFYWLFPFVVNLLLSTVDLYGAGRDAVFKGFLGATSYVYNVNFFHYPGFIAKNLHQTDLHYYFYFLFPILILIILLIRKKKDIYILWAVFLYLLFTELSLGPKSIFFGTVWIYLWDNFSFFSFFRSFRRFLIPIIPLLLLIFALFISRLNGRKYKINILILILIVSLLYFNKIYFTEFNKVVFAAKIPDVYYELNDYVEKDKENFSILAFPIINYESYTWASKKDYYFQSKFLTKPVIYDRVSLMLNNRNDLFGKVFTRGAVDYSNMDNYIDSLNVKYVLIHKDYIDVSSKKIVDYKKYEDYFLNSFSYEMVFNNNNFYLFRNKLFLPLIESSNVLFKKEHNGKISIYLSELSEVRDLNFLNNFNGNWGLYIKKYPTYGWCDIVVENESLKDCGESRGILNFLDFRYLFERDLFTNTHGIVYSYANRWSIDPIFIRQGFSKDYYIENSDESIDIELVLYYKPQLYFYIGLFSFILVVFVIIYCLIRRRGIK